MPSRALPTAGLYLLLCGLGAANIDVYGTIFTPRVPEIRVFAAGKGIAILVHTPRGKDILIDTGSDAGVLRDLGESLPEWQRSLDAVLLTSNKAAQTGGLASILARYEVGEVLRAGTVEFPYGARISADKVSLTVAAPGRTDISYGIFSFSVSSTTPEGVYRSDGETSGFK